MKTLRVMLLFFILLYGCSKKYLVSTEEELINREIIASWKSLAGEIRGRSNKKFTLNLKIKDFIKTEDSVKLTEIYKTGENINWAQVLLGGGGVYYGYLYMYSNWPDNEISHGCLGLGLLIPGLVAIADGLTKGYPFTKIIPDRIKIDTVCVDSMLLSKRKIVVSIEKVDLKKKYYTDEDGNVKLKFDEIIPKLTKRDSIIGLIIQYEDLIDTVKVKIK